MYAGTQFAPRASEKLCVLDVLYANDLGASATAFQLADVASKQRAVKMDLRTNLFITLASSELRQDLFYRAGAPRKLEDFGFVRVSLEAEHRL